MLLRTIALLILVSIAAAVIRGLIGMLQPPPKAPFRAPATGHLVEDPVCGTYVAKETAPAARNEFFCSEECRATFLKRSQGFDLPHQ
jgi:YHS domain-containing protein